MEGCRRGRNLPAIKVGFEERSEGRATNDNFKEAFIMNYQNYKEAMELAPKCKFYTTVGGKSQEDIRKSEELASFCLDL